jgi:hypothetical protein
VIFGLELAGAFVAGMATAVVVAGWQARRMMRRLMRPGATRPRLPLG